MALIQEIDSCGPPLPNNNPGNAPDYVTNPVIALRRYNGAALSHEQGDDRVEILRHRVNCIDDIIQIINNNVTLVNNEVSNIDVEINESFIAQLFSQPSFMQQLTALLLGGKVEQDIIYITGFKDEMAAANGIYHVEASTAEPVKYNALATDTMARIAEKYNVEISVLYGQNGIPSDFPADANLGDCDYEFPWPGDPNRTATMGTYPGTGSNSWCEQYGSGARSITIPDTSGHINGRATYANNNNFFMYYDTYVNKYIVTTKQGQRPGSSTEDENKGKGEEWDETDDENTGDLGDTFQEIILQDFLTQQTFLDFIDNRLTLEFNDNRETIEEDIKKFIAENNLTFAADFITVDQYNELKVTVENFVSDINAQITLQLGPYINLVNSMEVKLNALTLLLQQVGDGDIDLSTIIDAFDALSADILVNSQAIATLSGDLTTLINAVSLLSTAHDTIVDLVNELAANQLAIIDFIDNTIGAILSQLNTLFNQIAGWLSLLMGNTLQNMADIDFLLVALSDMAKLLNDEFVKVWDNINNLYALIEDLEKRLCVAETEASNLVNFMGRVACERLDVCEDGVIAEKLILTVPTTAPVYDPTSLDYKDGNTPGTTASIVLDNGQCFRLLNEDNHNSAVTAGTAPPAGTLPGPGAEWESVDCPGHCWSFDLSIMNDQIENCQPLQSAQEGQVVAALARQAANQNFNERHQGFNDALQVRRAAINANLAAQIAAIGDQGAAVPPVIKFDDVQR